MTTRGHYKASGPVQNAWKDKSRLLRQLVLPVSKAAFAAFDTGKKIRPREGMPGIPSLGLVVTARGKHPIPSRTRPLSSVAPMVLRLKTWESRSPPDQYLNFSLFTDAPNPP